METRPVTMATRLLKNTASPELRVLEAVIAACADTGDDSDKYVLDLCQMPAFYRIIRDCGHQRGATPVLSRLVIIRIPDRPVPRYPRGRRIVRLQHR